MTERTTYQLWYGRDEPPIPSRHLTAGPVTAELVGRDLRNVRYGGIEIAQRIYVAIRDRNWDTIPGDVSDLTINDGGDHFAVRFTVTHRRRDIDLVWQGEILGAPDGTISYAMDAVAGADMTYKLIGLNVHHGMKAYVGASYEGVSPAGPVSGVFTEEISPQLIADETEIPIFPDVSSLTARLPDDVAVRFDFAGDTFEFEDQRNWTDGSFKSQSYPPRRGGFFSIQEGELIHQQVTITASGAPPASRVSTSSSSSTQTHAFQPDIAIALGASTGTTLPPIGFGMASHGQPLSARETRLLRAFQPAHLRADLHLSDLVWPAELGRAAAACQALDGALELALFVTANAAAELVELALRLPEVTATVPVARILVFHEREQATSPRWLHLAHERLHALAPDALFVGGANANFCELNRVRPERPPGDGIVYAITPQIHAFDERSMAENLAPQAETVKTTLAFGRRAPVVVGPITLKQRFNAVATAATAEPDPGELPDSVDARQMSLFAAGWTTGSVKYLAQAGASSLTYYETTGWRGVIERDDGSPQPDLFLSRPGDVFPLYHVFADLAEWWGAELIAANSADPLAVELLALTSPNGIMLLLANLTPEAQNVRITAIPDGASTIRRLNEHTAPMAMTDPERFRENTETVPITEGRASLTLLPFEVARLDAPR